MKFGATTIDQALGAIAVHSVRAANRLVRKGTVISPEDIAALVAFMAGPDGKMLHGALIDIDAGATKTI